LSNARVWLASTLHRQLVQAILERVAPFWLDGYELCLAVRNDDNGETIRPGFLGESRCVRAIRLELFLQLLLFAEWRGAAATRVMLERREASARAPC
jgi:hypothetical protein